METKKKFYVVWEGKITGVFSSWEQCKIAVEGFPNAKYKSFPSEEMAKKAFLEKPEKHIFQKNEKTQVIDNQSLTEEIKTPSICVDAACSGNPGVMEYRGVDTFSKEEIFRIAPMQGGTNNIGEFLAIVHALALMKKKNLNYPIYSDSKIAIGWIFQKKCKTNVEKNSKNAPIFELITRAEKWLAENSFPNKILKWETAVWGEIPADFGRK